MRNYFSVVRSVLVVLFLLSVPVLKTWAFDVGNMTYELAPQDSYISRAITNRDAVTSLYSVTVYRINHPGAGEKIIDTFPHELLFSPREWLVPPGDTRYFKLYYLGKKDSKERYYRVIFTSHPLSLIHSSGESLVQKRVIEPPSLSLSTILVVDPENIHLTYTLDKKTGILANTGNTFFKVIFGPTCNFKSPQQSAYYLLPGQHIQSDWLKTDGEKLIVTSHQYISLEPKCPLG